MYFIITSLRDALKLRKCDTAGVVFIEQFAKIDYFLPARHPYLLHWDLVLLKYFFKFCLVYFVEWVQSLDEIQSLPVKPHTLAYFNIVDSAIRTCQLLNFLGTQNHAKVDASLIEKSHRNIWSETLLSESSVNVFPFETELPLQIRLQCKVWLG